MDCCKNPICFECITKWINQKKSTCPYCRAEMDVPLDTEVEREELQEERVKLAHDRGLIEYMMASRVSSTYISSGTFYYISMNRYKECFKEMHIKHDGLIDQFDDVWEEYGFYSDDCAKRTIDYNILSRWLGVGPYNGLNHRSIADLYERHMVDYYDKELPYIHELLEWDRMVEILDIDDNVGDHTPYYHIMRWILGVDIEVSEKLYLEQRKYFTLPNG